MKYVLALFLSIFLGACSTYDSAEYYPPQGNVSKENYEHVSGVENKNNAHVQLLETIATGAAGAVGSATVGGLNTVQSVDENIRKNIERIGTNNVE